MEKINYGHILTTLHPDVKWSIEEGKKQYEYDAYVWEDESIDQEILDTEWNTLKRELWYWKEIISKRDKLLADSDKYMMPDYPHASDEVRQQWVDYRQQLRDITTADLIYPTISTVDVVWPDKPL